MIPYYETDNGKLYHCNNLDLLLELDSNSIDSCISDFPYDLKFMGKKWDNIGDFYNWNKKRAEGLLKVIKPGGYVAIFGHPKTNHRMKCAFEDAGFRIVEEVEWVYLSGLPKNQDIGKLFDKKAGVQREVIGVEGLHNFSTTGADMNHAILGKDSRDFETANQLTAPSTEQSKKWDGWKTAGLKPSHEPITIFQKPLKGKYIDNIEKYGCGGMNIDACRVPISKSDIDILNAKSSKNATTTYSDKESKVYGKYKLDIATPANEKGRFPSNIILDEYMAEFLDYQTGVSKSSGGSGDKSKNSRAKNVYGAYKNPSYCDGDGLGGYGDSGGGSRIFTIIKYNPKVAPSERTLPNNERNPHVTLKPIELIKWLIKLLTPIDGTTIDITAGTCTHALACEELNKSNGYNLKWIDCEVTNTEQEPYCEISKIRIEGILGE